MQRSHTHIHPSARSCSSILRRRQVATAARNAQTLSSSVSAGYKPPPPGSSLHAESTQHFYRNKTLDRYVQQSQTPITLRQLLFYERHMNTDRLLKSANYVRQELPIRISHRIREFQKLPFIVGTNPHIQYVYDLYWQAFERLRKVPPIRTSEENDAFCRILDESLEAHMVVIPRLALGISECGKHIPPDRMDRFMNATLRSRISRRVLAEQHLALSHQLRPSSHAASHGSTVFSNCSAYKTINQCAAVARAHLDADESSPQLIIEGDDVWFTYIYDHIEYIMYQLLSNAFRHVRRTHGSSNGSPTPPVRVTICSNNTDVFFRVSDQGGGISADIYRQLWSYGHGRFWNIVNISHFAAKITEYDQYRMTMGIGLPMSRVYAEYFGGDINIVTMDGWGTDAYLRIPRLGTQNENLDVDRLDEASSSSSSSSPPKPVNARRFIV